MVEWELFLARTEACRASNKEDRVSTNRKDDATTGSDERETHLLSESLEEVVDEVVGDSHSLVANSELGVDL